MSTLPMVHRVVELLFTDQALSVPKNYMLPKWFDGVVDGGEIDWDRVEQALARTGNDLETFTIGDEEEQKVIRDRTEDGEYAHHAIDTLFLVMIAA